MDAKRAADTLRSIRRNDSATWLAYQVEASLRQIVTAHEIDEHAAATVLDRWCGSAQRSCLEPFVKLARTIRAHREWILARDPPRLGIRAGRGFQPSTPATTCDLLGALTSQL